MNEQMWLDLMKRLGFDANLNTYSKLQSHYAQKHRHYHNADHINATLKSLVQAKHLATNYNALELALWFHDAIYNVFASNNELDSANWAADFLQLNNATDDLIENVHRLIMATLHNAVPSDNDEMLIVDIDLAILGCNKDLYKEFEKWVRKEYKLIPYFLYKKKRKEILQGFLARKRIFSHKYFFDMFEQSARKNLKYAIESL
jgi:predicted metal-dependent HD superfamily phosphohydrolase